MKAELFVRMYHLQQDKLDACLEFNENVAQLMTKYVGELSSEIKDEFITIAQKFINRYNELLGEEGSDEKEKEEG